MPDCSICLDIGVSLDINAKLKYALIKLVDDKRESRPYICLSYAWADSHQSKTTRNTLHKYKNGIPLPSLPRIFQDAVYFVRRMSGPVFVD